MLRMEEVGTIRHLVLAEGWTIRRVARELRVSRNTIRRYLAGAEPGLRKQVVRVRPVLGRVQARLDALLAEAPRWTQGKQRLTATRLHRLLYDKLRPAVARVLVGAARVLTARMQALVAHYAFEPSFARPGTGHDKGGVESRGRAIRWQDLVPIPAGPDLETISQRLLARLDGRLATQRDAEGRTLGERFAAEQAALLPLPAPPFLAAA